MTPAQLNAWLNSRRKSNTWLNLPETQANFKAGGVQAVSFAVEALQKTDQPIAVREGVAFLLGELSANDEGERRQERVKLAADNAIQKIKGQAK